MPHQHRLQHPPAQTAAPAADRAARFAESGELHARLILINLGYDEALLAWKIRDLRCLTLVESGNFPHSETVEFGIRAAN
jgi:hypothetical protein